MKIKGITIGDMHLRSSRPAARTDTNYLLTQLGKFEWCLAQAEARECDVILQVGDITDRPDQAPKVIISFQRLLAKYNIPFVCTLGQHDVIGHNISTYEDETAVGIFATNDLVTILRAGNSYDIGGVVKVFGYAFGEPETAKYLKGKVKHPDESFNIALVHASVGWNQLEGAWESISAQKPTCEWTFFGDIHDGWEGYYDHAERGRRWSFNPGAMMRMNQDERDRKPKIIYWEIADDHGVYVTRYEELVIPHQPGDIAFDAKVIQENMDQKMDDWRLAMAKSREMKAKGPVELVKEMAGRLKTPEPAVHLVLHELAEIQLGPKKEYK